MKIVCGLYLCLLDVYEYLPAGVSMYHVILRCLWNQRSCFGTGVTYGSSCNCMLANESVILARAASALNLWVFALGSENLLWTCFIMVSKIEYFEAELNFGMNLFPLWFWILVCFCYCFYNLILCSFWRWRNDICVSALHFHTTHRLFMKNKYFCTKGKQCTF